jgi:ABC-type sugar transport system ATPase subunit
MTTVRYVEATRTYAGTDTPAVDSLNLDIADGELLVLVGPSGSGKSTALRMLAGLEPLDAGVIQIGDRDVSNVRPRDRDIAMVFQNYALYPQLSVAENMGFALKQHGVPKEERITRVRETARILDLEPFLDRKPRHLSGGQQQRVALARALAPSPDILLLDEPLSNLDANLRGDMRFEIRRLHEEFRYTSIYVTHDQVEAMTMADRIVVMNAGRIEQIGTPEDVYERPKSRFVAKFIGASNVIDARHVGDNRVEVAGHTLAIGQGDFAGPGRDMSFCVKTHDVELLPESDAPANNMLPGVVRSQAYLGSHRDYVVDVGQELLIAAPASLEVPTGSKVKVRFRPERCRGLAV